MKALSKGITKMNFQELQNYTEYLFRLALKKCGDINDAEDITQETLLCALCYPKEIANVKAWLSSVLCRKYNDMLRRKYKLPTVGIDFLPEEYEIWENDCSADRPSESEVRREVAYLAEKYRTVIVKHYLNGEKVDKIAEELKIPRGTVLSRLSVGREQMRKGFEIMKNHGKQSYSPEKLSLGLHGEPGLSGEPMSVVDNDLMKQNILIAAYSKPLTVTEIALTLGIPTAYIESAVSDLVCAELMKKSGNKYFTDFMIMTPDYLDRVTDVQTDFTKENYALLLKSVNEFTERIKSVDFVGEISENKRKKLIYYFVLNLFSCAVYTVLKRIFPSDDIFPERPNGGRWVAVGVKFQTDDIDQSCKFTKYSYGGERFVSFENFMSAGHIGLHIYDTPPEQNKYQHGPVGIKDDELVKMLYIISRGIPFECTGFNLMLCQDIPHLTKCDILGEKDGCRFVNVPILSSIEYNRLNKICMEYMQKMSDSLTDKMRELMPKIKIDLPRHLEGRITELRQYNPYLITMAFIKSADEKGDIDFAENLPPMVFTVDDANKIR